MVFFLLAGFLVAGFFVTGLVGLFAFGFGLSAFLVGFTPAALARAEICDFCRAALLR